MATTDRAPLFGVSLDPERTVPFRLRSYGPRDPETKRPRETDHEFTARAEIDAATALGAIRGGEGAQAAVFVRFLRRALIDDDGVPNDAMPVRSGDEIEDGDDEGDEPGTEVELSGPGLDSDEWEIEGKRFPSHSLALQHASENGSSLRRFADLMDDPTERVHLKALQEIVKYIAKEGGGRPTKPSQPSRKPPTRRRR